MIAKKLCYVLLLPFALSTGAAAQQLSNDFYQQPNQTAVQLTVGSQGVGADVNHSLSQRFALRGGVSFIPLRANNLVHVSGFNSTSSASLNFSNVHLLGDFTPFGNMPGLRLVFGSAYFMQADGNFELQPTDSYKYGEIALSQADVGKVNMNASWKGIAPYLGLGLARILPKQFFNVKLDIGAYYLNQPKAAITGTGLLEGSALQTEQLNTNISHYRFLPVIQLNFNFKLSKR